ncbi:FimB/Mfa2 family fimbrial subunit [Chitinophaga varians]|uniref:FimB/Mfa2 family fimbrial subunit n=1 Tax=Chitinophaga varians TaxID=2202339 RepID=UPI00165FE423|nr:FimB/Mfa2 family fimbrial subunit [Chitinophaga varians]MBC9915613.1 FimB/Mfa2 family fimbrial subunit [Chitinophaga varians]
MKKALIIPLLSSIFFSCSKDATDKKVISQGEKQPVKFSVANFSQSQENLRTAGNNQLLEGQTSRVNWLPRISDLYYIVYSSDGNKINFVHQDTLNQKANFGIINDSLAPGTYTAVLIASQTPLYTQPITSSNNISGHYFSPQLMGMGVFPMGDAFLKKTVFSVSANAPTEIPITLERVVGKLEVKLQDALPSSDPNGYIRVQVSPLSVAYNLSDGSVRAPEAVWQWYGTRKDQYTFSDFLLGSEYEFNVDINYKDRTTGADLKKTIQHVKCQTNKVTVIKGYLYGAPPDGSRSYSITINDTWSTDSTLINL